jgi:ABC-type branched-subunit amino acid transport system substrate-binding protein
MGRRGFIDEAGTAADGVLFPLLCDPSVLSGRFSETFTARFGRRPDCTAAQTYDATRLLIAAIGSAGLNRARIRDAVRALSPWSGASGPIEWNRLGQNQRQVLPATIEKGRVVPIQ